VPLKIYKRGDVWHYRGTVAKRRLRGSTGATNKEIAQQIASEVEGKAWKRRLAGPAAVLTFAQASIKYRAAGKQDRFLEKIEDYWKDTLVRDITPGAIREAARTIYPMASAATRNRQAIVPMQAVINHCAESELCPRIRVKRFKVDTKSKVPATLEWVQTFMAHCKRPQLAGLALFMFLTGARISEALAVEWDDIDFKAKSVLIRQTKLGNERRAHLPDDLIAALQAIPRTMSPRSVFWYETRAHCLMVWRRTAARAKIAPLSFHSCRHGFATALLRKGVDVITVAKLGGWKNVRHVLETYGHAMDDPTLTNLIADEMQSDLQKGENP
jgi:integrase